ncbi:SDR family NAD(P)-dependent oxidoreductase [Amorphus orientalis]|uniref:NAD(P)-dependent dehydrogenase (Short-subunit alcohol dehydrogenase family) n=1 Tax=Amorphus orientalis TaxID=649198 RepID=A0AAE3VNK6_9HYPH|nr:SDR family NAD(P)-dependent oxidoreductase [Amorphus orientalis]MDQ0314976.1 NAD(P)-dependent dehydrogenase (short-subunit alcohol dehydrogenase family) [Amorphus orientalis]
MAALEEMFCVAGKSVIVTGGASGIGRAYAEVMAEHGARVCICDADEAQLERTVAEIGKGTWGRWLDVSDSTGVAAAFDEVAEHQGRVDIVFANAGVDGGPGFLTPEGRRNSAGQIDAIPLEMWDRVIAVNLTGVFLTIRNAARHMKQTGGGRIIVTSSVAARVNEAIVGLPYMPAKAGVDHLVRNAAMELGAFGILVNCISPGPFVTNIAGGRLKNAADRSAFEEQSLLGRIAETEEIKGLALYLASPAASYVTGAQMTIDGGSSLRT